MVVYRDADGVCIGYGTVKLCCLAAGCSIWTQFMKSSSTQACLMYMLRPVTAVPLEAQPVAAAVCLQLSYQRSHTSVFPCHYAGNFSCVWRSSRSNSSRSSGLRTKCMRRLWHGSQLANHASCVLFDDTASQICKCTPLPWTASSVSVLQQQCGVCCTVAWEAAVPLGQVGPDCVVYVCVSVEGMLASRRGQVSRQSAGVCLSEGSGNNAACAASVVCADLQFVQ
jgi:hypothetical protein